jgi:quinol monooxygenase YgiN
MSYRVLLESKAKTSSKDSLFAFLENNQPIARSFKGCLNVSILYNAETNLLLFVEEWLSKEDHQADITFIEKNGVMAKLADFLVGPPTINYYKRVVI